MDPRLRPPARRGAAHLTLALTATLLAGPARADEKIANPIAVFSGLDKITGRITTFDASIDATVDFGTLKVTPRVCYTRPPTEAPQTTAFVEVDDVSVDQGTRRIFTGWVFAASPGLNALEHPIYDVWLIDCKTDSGEPESGQQ